MAYHATDSATDGVCVAPTTDPIKGAVSTFDTAPPSHTGARIDPSNDTTTAANYLTVRQATPSVVAQSATIAAHAVAAAATGTADSRPSFDSGTSLDTGYGPCSRNVTAGSGKDGAVGATKAIKADTHTDTRGRGFGTRADVRTAPITATDTVADARRRPTPGRSLGRL